MPTPGEPSLWDRLAKRFPLPYPHFMGFAPLDCWARLLLSDRAILRISPKYWARILGALFTSTLGTALTLPERLLLAPILARRVSGRAGADAAPPSLFILGYYRSGTTHLHYLLSCDPQLVTPRWYQALAPHGFALSWTFLRYFLVPFLSSTRPQDDVAYGPEYPAEDDFAVCNSNAACTMPGRMVLPGCWEHYRRYHDLRDLTPTERRRFARAQLAFTCRLAALNPRKRLLLKTPAHTARLSEMVSLYGPRARFIHISRTPAPVLASNIAMHRRFAPFLLQDHPGDDDIRRRVIEEYDRTERIFIEQREALADQGRGVAACMRYEDLIADPLGEVRRVYAELGLTLSDAAERRMLAYLDSVRDYRTASQRDKGTAVTAGPAPSPDFPAPELAWMIPRFGHDRAAIPKVEPALASGSRPEQTDDRHAAGNPYLTASLAALWCAALWLLVSFATHNRLDWLVWPVGVAIGLAALRSAGKGRPALGVWCAALTLAVLALVAYPATWMSDYQDRSPVPWDHVWISTRRGVLAMNNAMWILLGAMTAYRFGSRQHLRPPGL